MHSEPAGSEGRNGWSSRSGNGGTGRQADSSSRAAAAPSTAVAEVIELFDARGGEHYGEEVDQRRHALQTATSAQELGGDDAVVVAALLHDVGHLVHDLEHGGRTGSPADDTHHEAIGARWLSPRFGPRVARYVALHVLAKRYQCTVDPEYVRGLSRSSHLSFLAQGGALEPGEVARFTSMPDVESMLLLRRCDELGKDPERETVGIEAFVPLLERFAVTTSTDSDASRQG